MAISDLFVDTFNITVKQGKTEEHIVLWHLSPGYINKAHNWTLSDGIFEVLFYKIWKIQ